MCADEKRNEKQTKFNRRSSALLVRRDWHNLLIVLSTCRETYKILILRFSKVVRCHSYDSYSSLAAYAAGMRGYSNRGHSSQCIVLDSITPVSVGVVFSPLCFLWGPGSTVQSDKRWFDLDATLKAVDATKASGLIPGEGTITANPSGAIWETSTYRTHRDKIDDYSPSFTQIYVKVVDKLSSCGSVSSDEVDDYSWGTQLGFTFRVRPVFWNFTGSTYSFWSSKRF